MSYIAGHVTLQKVEFTNMTDSFSVARTKNTAKVRCKYILHFGVNSVNVRSCDCPKAILNI